MVSNRAAHLLLPTHTLGEMVCAAFGEKQTSGCRLPMVLYGSEWIKAYSERELEQGSQMRAMQIGEKHGCEEKEAPKCRHAAGR